MRLSQYSKHGLLTGASEVVLLTSNKYDKTFINPCASSTSTPERGLSFIAVSSSLLIVVQSSENSPPGPCPAVESAVVTGK